MSIDNILSFNISLGAPAVSRLGFGTPLLLAASLEAGFTERIRFYSGVIASDADVDLDADAKARLTTAFGQSQVPKQIAVGRREADVAQVDDFTLTGAADGDYTITVNGTPYTVAAAAQTTAQIVDALAPLVNANPDVTAVSDTVDTITVTSSTAGLAFTAAAVTDGIGSSWAQVATTPNVSAATELSAIAAENDNFYGLVLDARSDTDTDRVNTWISARAKIFFAQTSSADVITAATTDIASTLQTASAERTAVLYYSDDAVHADIAWLTRFLAANFDQEAPTAWGHLLVGIATENLSDTAETNLRAKNANWYTTFKGVGAIANAQVAGGFDIELIVTRDWLQARGSEDIAQVFLDASNANSRIRYNNAGFQRIGGVFFAVLKAGERIGHFNDETSEISIPDRNDPTIITPTEIANGNLPIVFGTQYSGRVKTVAVTGVASTSFITLTP